ncbi:MULTISPECIES: bifunctional metallophosphatase/5'-nucleotidase [unclassified Sphingobium]|uniref:bifunctional metallophosphatase/5'-nucleotidase n=1 Tax=unclassified Sphingobium TaxID=2611147 RepID=UPI0022252DFB|nr:MULTISPECIES: bifunctional metallophosphatase/5'-nucleotidase [unclassified Sphingobium]MCW2412801.1 5'-nucleotidase [Sphingobium sp. B8D3D]MCW2414901.1 5'-nucleotidase [Sphingobium sp. B8D3A]
MQFSSMIRASLPLGLLLLGACAQTAQRPASPAGDSIARLQIIAFNDFHGHIDTVGQTVLPPGAAADAPRTAAGGAIHFAQAVSRLRAENPNSAVVSAGDMISASPLISGHFLDEPTIRVMNKVGVDFNSVGNHEFDRGPDELRRMQTGGCTQFTRLQPCQVMSDFPGARFGFLAANVQQADGQTLFPAYGLKRFALAGGKTVTIGFVGVTLKGTPEIVAPSGVANLRFLDEAEAANSYVAALKQAGAEILVLLIHEGGYPGGEGDPGNCGSLSGPLPQIMARLDPAFDLVISGHTHQAYVCRYGTVDASRPLLATSAGQYGTLLTRITLDYDVAAHRLVDKRAENLLVEQREDAPVAQPELTDLVARYRTAASSVSDRVVGKLAGSLTQIADVSGQSTLGNFIADAQLASVQAPERGGAQLALMNPGGLRAPIAPLADGSVRFGDLYSAQPFGNVVLVKQLSGADIRAALEQQFTRGDRPSILSVSRGFSYEFDASRPAGARVFNIRLNGAALRDEGTYRVAMNNFIAQGGDGLRLFAPAPVLAEGPVDVDALEVYIASDSYRGPPALDRIRNVTPQ